MSARLAYLEKKQTEAGSWDHSNRRVTIATTPRACSSSNVFGFTGISCSATTEPSGVLWKGSHGMQLRDSGRVPTVLDTPTPSRYNHNSTNSVTRVYARFPIPCQGIAKLALPTGIVLDNPPHGPLRDILVRAMPDFTPRLDRTSATLCEGCGNTRLRWRLFKQRIILTK
jgi:hypothetical protein